MMSAVQREQIARLEEYGVDPVDAIAMLASAWHAGWMAGGNDAIRPNRPESPVTPCPYVLPPVIPSRADLEWAVREAIALGVGGESVDAVQLLMDRFPTLEPAEEA